MKNIIAYLNKLRQSYVGPSGQIASINTALKMLVARIPDCGKMEEEKELVVRAKIIETKNTRNGQVAEKGV